MTINGSTRASCIVALLALAFGASGLFAPSALAEVRGLPVPAKVIYPGDIIVDNSLVDTEDYKNDGLPGQIIQDRAGLIGKVARRTLLPGRRFPPSPSRIRAPCALAPRFG